MDDDIEMEVIKDLPVGSLSYSAVMEYLRCPIKYKRKYIDHQWEPRSLSLVRGNAFDQAATENYRQKIETHEDLAAADVLDLYDTAWTYEMERSDDTEVVPRIDEDYGYEKDQGYRITGAHMDQISPHVQPVRVQTYTQMHFPNTNWTFTGKLDVETDSEVVADMKTKSRAFSQAELEGDLQSTSYLALRRANGDPARRFEFHLFRDLKAGIVTDMIPVERANWQLDAFQTRIAMIAKEIAWRAENEFWSPALPGNWWCTKKYCGFWSQCEFGGGRPRG